MIISVPITCKTPEGNKTVDKTPILLDTGAGGLFMNHSFANKHNILLHKLTKPIIPRNVDGTQNKAGIITHFTWIQTEIDGRVDQVCLLITEDRKSVV